MAKKKRKSKGKKKGTSSATAEEEAVAASESEGSDEDAEASADDEDDEDAADGYDDAEDEADEEEVAAAPRKAGRAEKATVNIRPGATAAQNPLIPSPDGPRVSHKGGLIFVAIVAGLMGLAIAAQFVMG